MTGVRPNTELSTELKRVFNEGGDGELIAAIKERRWRELRRLVPRERALCAIAKKLSATAPRVTVEDWEALRSLGFDEMGCLEVAHIVGIFNYLTRLADGFGLELHPALREAARSGIPLRAPAASYPRYHQRLETDIPMIIWRIEPLILETGQSVMRFEFIPLRQTIFEAPDSPERMRDGDRQFL